MEENILKVEKIVKEASDLMVIFEEFKNKVEINNKSSLLRYLDRICIAKNIVQYLNLKDLINLRSTCRDLNAAVSSTVAIVSYYKSINVRRNSQTQNSTKFLRPFNQLNSIDDMEIELENLNNIRDLSNQKLFQSESIIRFYKNDNEFLKSEIASQNEITDRLNETLSQTVQELEEARKNILHIQKSDDTVMSFDNSHYPTKLEDLSKEIEKLRNEKNNLTSGIFKLKKISEDLKKKNIEKSEALNSIKDFFINSTIFKIKNISDYEEIYSYNKEKINTTKI